MKITYSISELAPYINWVYYFYAWQVKDEVEKQRMQREALVKLQELENKYQVHAVFELFDARSEDDDIVIYRSMMCQECGVKHPVRVASIPCLRQQQGNPPYLCLADFIRPLNISCSSFLVPRSSESTSKLGLFATTVDIGLETDFDDDVYQKMMVQLLADRLAEAAAELLHLQVRKEYWGYAKDENLSIPDLLIERFQGIRPAVGYPSLPDTSLNFVLDDILDMKQIGIRLTESGAMKPHASVSGMMIANPKAKYFSIGKIGEDQLQDYARRRGIPSEVLRKWLEVGA
ncbi:vitamin B12 dependent-methionine synthase activation domain-containing protein [Xylanibacter ruminicola]|uniref:Vitamin B12 dependent methionine synthase, activation domain n=1 Tax=Xylanibacter ruminicola TaxID=839 RepID=A0A1M6X570_XYLRU|nr:vitamin B12 dependent-methionine synthase activation domain-containing protein [Xylanibacter ruminicola]SHL01073.1 Vitamin B12 dependent methionine synthase, activation domain [Xylanibacter ruminicola]